MKLSAYAKKMGVNYQTAYRWFVANKIPHQCEQLPSGTILVHVDTHTQRNTDNVVLYARVSSHDQKEDLERQLDRLRTFAASSGFVITGEFTEIASGMNSRRPKLNKILNDNSVTHIIVEHQDRLTRFGFELIESSLNATGRTITVINETPHEMDLVQDFIDVVTGMCARIYGARSAKNRIDRIKEVIDDSGI